jgi:hypothetical protein
MSKKDVKKEEEKKRKPFLLSFSHHTQRGMIACYSREKEEKKGIEKSMRESKSFFPTR